jgi:hypothetical protein
MHAGSPSLIVTRRLYLALYDARRLPFPYCGVHAPRPSLLTQHLPYCCTLYAVLAFSLVFSLTISHVSKIVFIVV